MSSIEEKLKTFEDLISQLDDLSKDFQNGLNAIEGQFNELKSSGNWNDPHASTFETGRLNAYKGSILSMLINLKEAKNFLAHKYETLKTHKNA